MLRCTRLRRDERGMILVVALPMAVILAACTFYLLSVGAAVVHRERLQDAADATAFDSAVLHARAMNAEVALNLLSATLGALPAALRGVEGLGAAALGGDARALLTLARSGERELVPRMQAAANIVRDTQLALRDLAPLIANGEATRRNTAFYRAQAAADGSIALSYAGLSARDQSQLRANPGKPWLLAPRTPLPAKALDAASSSGAGRLPLIAAEAANLPASLALSPDAENGNAILQVWAVARRERFAAASWAERGIGLLRPDRPLRITAKNAAFAQAELYFDCADSWSRCAANAAWSPRWTARMRRFERPDGSSDPARTRRIARAFTSASDALDRPLRTAGHRDARARDYVRTAYDSPPCGANACLH